MICIVGADGFFGTYLQKHILPIPGHEHIVCLDHTSSEFSESAHKTDLHFELRDKDSLKAAADILSRYSDIKIVFSAAVHAPDIVKKNPEDAQYINTVCYESFLNEIKGLDIKRLIYCSSDTVYGESRNGYAFSERDKPDPINIYGRQKLLAEEITHRHGFTVARYSYMCAPSLTSRKKHFFDEVANKLRSGERVYMMTDWVRSSLSYKTAAEITYRLLFSDTRENVINICSDEPTSKYDIGLKIAEYTDSDPSLVIPCTMESLGIFTEKRANDIIMDNSLSKKLGIAGSTHLVF